MVFPESSDKPKSLEKMLEFARALSKDIPHIRMDFYCIDDRVYFGELTFYHGSGFEKFSSEELNLQMGNWINLAGGDRMKI